MVTQHSLDSSAHSPPVAYYHELKNLGNGNYLCEVWSPSTLGVTLMKLTASEKAKLKRSRGR